jgi:hypothetical protein
VVAYVQHRALGRLGLWVTYSHSVDLRSTLRADSTPHTDCLSTGVALVVLASNPRVLNAPMLNTASFHTWQQVHLGGITCTQAACQDHAVCLPRTLQYLRVHDQYICFPALQLVPLIIFENGSPDFEALVFAGSVPNGNHASKSKPCNQQSRDLLLHDIWHPPVVIFGPPLESTIR